MEALTIHPRNEEQLNALKVIFTEMKIPFEKAEATKKVSSAVEEDTNPYDPEFVKKIKQGEMDKKAGHYTTYSLEELDDLCK